MNISSLSPQAEPEKLPEKLSGFNFEVSYSSGIRERAVWIANINRDAHSFLSELLNFSPTIKILILNRYHWSHYATFPVYGMPHYADDQTLIVAAEDNDFWQALNPPLKSLSADLQKSMLEIYGKNNSLDLSVFFDWISLHEQAHLFHFQALIPFPRLWIRELFCNLVVYTFLAEKLPHKLPEFEVLPEAILNGEILNINYTTLSDFERLYVEVGLENYGWYQSRFIAGAKKIYLSEGKNAVKAFWEAFKENEPPFSEEALGEILRKNIGKEAEFLLTHW